MNAVDFAFKVAAMFDKTGDTPFSELYKLVEEKFTSANTGSPKLLDDALRAIGYLNGRYVDAAISVLESMVKQLRAGA